MNFPWKHFRHSFRCALSQVPLCTPRDWSPPGFSVRRLLQAGALEWVAISFSRRSSRPGIKPASCICCTGRGVYLLSSRRAEGWEVGRKSPVGPRSLHTRGITRSLQQFLPHPSRRACGVSCISAGTRAGSSWSMKGRGLSPPRWLENLELGLALCEAWLGSLGLSPRPAFSPPFCSALEGVSCLVWLLLRPPDHLFMPSRGKRDCSLSCFQ